MPIIRTEVEGFARVWNNHTIRKQPKKPNAVVGQPFMLYQHSARHGVDNYGIIPSSAKLAQLRNGVDQWGMYI